MRSNHPIHSRRAIPARYSHPGVASLEFEQRNLSENSLNELRRYFREIVAYCKDRGVLCPDELTPEFLKDCLDQRCKDVGPTTKKAVVWALRKLGRFMALLRVVKKDPARDLRHSEIHPRSRLPGYLSETELRKLLEYASGQGDKSRDNRLDGSRNCFALSMRGDRYDLAAVRVDEGAHSLMMPDGARLPVFYQAIRAMDRIRCSQCANRDCICHNLEFMTLNRHLCMLCQGFNV